MKSLPGTLFASLLVLSAPAAFAEETTDLGSPWWDSEYVQVNPSADDDKAPLPQPGPDGDKDKS